MVEEDEEPYVRKAREALLAALRVRGERPLYSMDPSELTVPVRVHSGGHATIMQGIRDGELVAVKVRLLLSPRKPSPDVRIPATQL